jgi:DNA-directed RNA polymerase specialized sigma24 family protein
MTNEKPMNDVRHLDNRSLRDAAVEGDPEAFGEIMRRFDPVVRAGIERLVSPDAVDDLIAEVWCLLMRQRMSRLRAWDPTRHVTLGAWLMRIARELATRLAAPHECHVTDTHDRLHPSPTA